MTVALVSACDALAYAAEVAVRHFCVYLQRREVFWWCDTGFLLHKLMPWWFGAPALTQLGSTLPYSEIERRVNRDAAAALVAVLAAVAAVVLKLLRVW